MHRFLLRPAGLVFAVVFVLLSIGAALADLPPDGTFTDDNLNIHEPDIEAIAAEGPPGLPPGSDGADASGSATVPPPANI